jgi:hypothetical protein
MTNDDLNEISGVLMAHSFIMENIVAMMIAQDEDPIAATRATAIEMQRQFALPARGIASVETKQAILSHGAAHLDRFWKAVERRLASTLQDR